MLQNRLDRLKEFFNEPSLRIGKLSRRLINTRTIPVKWKLIREDPRESNLLDDGD